MNFTPTLIKKKNNGEHLLISFDDNSNFIISSELLRVESPSADIQGHGGPKVIVRNKSNVLIDQIEPVGNYAVRIIFLTITLQASIVGNYCMILEKS